jgi:hypothetical protein
VLLKTLVLFVASLLGLRCGQTADLGFDVTVPSPAYPRGGPRVVIDAGHRNFHTADGTYLPFAQLLRHDGYTVTSSTTLALERVDLLVVANARQPFTPPECDAIEAWVSRGGALLLVTDHPPVGERMQPLLDRFGVRGNLGELHDPAHHLGGMDGSAIIFTRLGKHPITDGVGPIATFTGQALRGPPGSVSLLPASPTAVEYHPYMVGPGRFEMGEPTPAPGASQAVALVHGRGRVVVTGEAAFLTAQREGHERFGMNLPGLDNRRLLRNMIHWLTGGAR